MRQQHTRAARLPHLGSNACSHCLRLRQGRRAGRRARAERRLRRGAELPLRGRPRGARGRGGRAPDRPCHGRAGRPAVLAPPGRHRRGRAHRCPPPGTPLYLIHIIGRHHSRVRTYNARKTGSQPRTRQAPGAARLASSVLQCGWTATPVAFSTHLYAACKHTLACSLQYLRCRPGIQSQSKTWVKAAAPGALQAEAHGLVEHERAATAAVKQLHASLLSERAAHVPVVRASQHTRRVSRQL